MAIVIALLVGVGGPIQTAINARLQKRLGTAYASSLMSFVVGSVFIGLVTLCLEGNIAIPFGELSGQPFWIWLGGLFGVIYVTFNILMMPRLGGVQTAIFPIFGQIVMGLLTDNFGLFRSPHIALTFLRALGGCLVLCGILVVTLSGAGKEKESSSSESRGALWAWRIAGIIGGMASAAQTAVNGYLGRTVGSSLKASFISFLVGLIILIVINLIDSKDLHWKNTTGEKYPWWIWIGGLFGSFFVIGSTWLSGVLGVGLTVVIELIGISIGGMLIDTFGLIGAEKKPFTLMNGIGMIIMIAGGAMVHLL